MTTDTGDKLTLKAQAEKFAADLTKTVAEVAPECRPFEARTLDEEGARRFTVHQEPDTGIPLTVDGESLLTLKVHYFCVWDTPEQFLAVESSSFKVYAGAEAAGEPLFRYDYVRSPHSGVPAAHLQIHAHRDGIAHVMSRAGRNSRRGRRRADASVGNVPRVSELHFPLGGARFRPCLEDLLEMLVGELGVDCSEGGRAALKRGREDWRLKQLRAVVRDSREEAADLLESLGYKVERPINPLPANTDKLREL